MTCVGPDERFKVVFYRARGGDDECLILGPLPDEAVDVPVAGLQRSLPFGFAVFAAVTYYASEYVASRDPLIPGLKVPDLRVSLGDLRGEVHVLSRELLLSAQNLVVKIEDLLIRHVPDLLSDFQVDRRDGGIVVLDYSMLAFSLDSYFV